MSGINPQPNPDVRPAGYVAITCATCGGFVSWCNPPAPPVPVTHGRCGAMTTPAVVPDYVARGREAARRLTADQEAARAERVYCGHACAVCHADLTVPGVASVPFGTVEGVQVFACSTHSAPDTTELAETLAALAGDVPQF